MGLVRGTRPIHPLTLVRASRVPLSCVRTLAVPAFQSAPTSVHQACLTCQKTTPTGYKPEFMVLLAENMLLIVAKKVVLEAFYKSLVIND